MSSENGVKSGVAVRSVLVVDDHPLMRRAIAELIDSRPALMVCGEAGSFAEALELERATRPHMLVIDITLGEGGDGIELTQRLCASSPLSRVLVCSMHDSAEFAERALRAGALGYVNKQADVTDLIDAAETVADNCVYADADTRDRLVDEYAARYQERSLARVAALTPDLRRMLELIGRGLGATEIADATDLGPAADALRAKLARAVGARSEFELHCIARTA